MVTRLVQQNQTQEKILDAAAQLFYEKGVQAVGVDEIVLQAGIAKMTLYKYFISKDQLIMAVVERSEQLWWTWFTTELRRRTKVAKKQLLVIFDLLLDSFQQSSSYKGQPFANARICVSDTMYPIFLVSENFRNQLKEFILDIVKLASIPNANQVADQFLILIMGLNVLSNFENNQTSKTSIRNAKKLATLIIKSSEETS